MRFLILVLLYLIPQYSSGNTFLQERSALWVVRYALTNRSSVDQIIKTALELKISDIFVQVRALGESYYPSDLEVLSSRIVNHFDPLQYIIDQSRGTGIKVHAWVNMFYTWSGDTFPKDNRHIFHQRSDYILRNDKFPKYKTLRAKGFEGYFLDPKVPAVQKDLLNILKEITEHYNISGIHLDYFRYPGLAYSFTPASRTIFMLEEIFDPLPLYQSPKQYTESRGYQVFLHADKVYRESLAEALSQYLRDISLSIKKIKPGIKVSVAVKPDPVQAKHRFFQDWIKWLKEEYCDFVVIMNYRTSWEEFDLILNQITMNKQEKKVIVGISTYNQNADAVLKRISLTRKNGFAGYSLFSYNYLIEHLSYLRKIKRELTAGVKNGF